MDNIQKLYEKLWKSLIRPQRFPYTEIDLGGEEIQFTTYNAVRMDFQLQNALQEKYSLSLYLPCDEDYNLQFHGEYIVYCHTHSGSRTEGLHLVEDSIERGIGIALFDFRASGYSSGKYVTLGWFEALDINQVVQFLKQEAKAKSICLWGRSMGGAAIVFFMSAKYRSIINRIFAKRKIAKVNWISQKAIDCVVLDSQFNMLVKSIHNMVSSRTNKIPAWIISLVVNMLETEIAKRSGIKLSLMNPKDFFKGLRTPIFCIVGNKDEMIKQKEFCENFQQIESKIKKFQIFVGNHIDDRPQHIIDQIFNFVTHVFSIKKIYLENLKNQPRKSRNSYSIFEPAPQISYLDYTMAQIQINKDTEKAFQPKNLIQDQNQIIAKQEQQQLLTIQEDLNENFSDLKNSLKKSKKFNPEDPNIKQLENDFNIITEEMQKNNYNNNRNNFVEFDKNLAENIIQEQKIPKASINMLRNQKYTEKSYLRGLSFQVKNSTLRQKFRNKSKLVKSRIQPNVKFNYQSPQKKQQQVIQQNQNLQQKKVFVPEYKQDFKIQSIRKVPLFPTNQQQPKNFQHSQKNIYTFQKPQQTEVKNSFQSNQHFIQNSFVPQTQQQSLQNPGRQTVPVQFVNYNKQHENLNQQNANFQKFQSEFKQNQKLQPNQNNSNHFQNFNPKFSQQDQLFQSSHQIKSEFFKQNQKSHQIGQTQIKETETIFLNFNKQSKNQLIAKTLNKVVLYIQKTI